MLSPSRSVLLACLALACKCLALPTTHAVHESRPADSVSARWLQKGRVEADRLLPVRVGLTQNNLEKGHDLVMAVSDPDSPSYGKHWTSDEVVNYFKPSDESVSAVKKWLEDSGISDISLSDNKAWLAFDLPASKVESLLHAEFYEYEDSVTKAKVPSCHSYSVPKSLQQHIDLITPGLKLVAPTTAKTAEAQSKRRASSSSSPNYGTATCDEAINPDCVAALYQIPQSTLTPNPLNKLGLYEAEFQRWDQTDLDLFFTNFTDGRIPNGTAPVNVAIDGGESETPRKFVSLTNGGEIELDIDVSYPIVYPQNIAIWDENDLYYQKHEEHADTTYWGFNQLLDAIDGSYCTYKAYGEKGDDPALDPKYPNKEPQGGFNGSLECGVFKPPYVLSSSYGSQEADIPLAYQARQCNEFMKLALQGTSFLWASGDDGVAGPPNPPGAPGGKQPNGCLGKDYTVFSPAWPNSCPYLTNVAATEVPLGNNVNMSEPEVAVYIPSLNFSSGGGFSNIYAMPSWQKTAVEDYLTKYTPSYPYYSALAKIVPNPSKVNVEELQGKTGGLYNRAGRAYPDVAANGWNYTVVIHGEYFLEGGTSQAAPLFASVINRIVEERLAAGKSSLGFLNPTLYKNPQILNDITSGTNPGCGTKGFKTAPGWDPVTGLGTPNYPKMLEFFMNLQ